MPPSAKLALLGLLLGALGNCTPQPLGACLVSCNIDGNFSLIENAKPSRATALDGED